MKTWTLRLTGDGDAVFVVESERPAEETERPETGVQRSAERNHDGSKGERRSSEHPMRWWVGCSWISANQAHPLSREHLIRTGEV